jgi:hypothetical protein
MAACYSDAEAPKIPGFFRLTLTFNQSPEQGKTPDKPRPVARLGEIARLNIQARRRQGNEIVDDNFDGFICLYTSRGLLEGTSKAIRVTNGRVEEQLIRIRLAFGKTSIWVGEVKPDPLNPPPDGVPRCPDNSNPADTTDPYVGQVGAADPVYYELLSIADLQESDVSPFDSPLFKKQAIIGRGRMVVTAVMNNGFYVTDLDGANNGYRFASLFIFTFSAPSLALDDGFTPRLIDIGERIHCVQGGVDEFGGNTQLTFPLFTPEWDTEKVECGKESRETTTIKRIPPDQMPPAIEIGTDIIWTRRSMEPYEAAIVEFRDVSAIPFPLSSEGWAEFRQWPFLMVKANNPDDREKCEDLIRTEIRLHTDPVKKTLPSPYRACLDACFQKRKEAEPSCAPNDADCLTKIVDAWYDCYFDCRFNRTNGLFKRLEDQGCAYGIMLAASSATVPEFDPTLPEHLNRRFVRLRGVLQQVRATAFYGLLPDQYPDEQSNNGYVLLIRNSDDIVVKE